METKALDIDWEPDKNGCTWLRLKIADGATARAYATAHAGGALRVKLTAWREKRSLSANAYAWELLGKLSEKLHIPPEEIYRRIIPDVGGNYVVASAPLENAEKLRETWEANGLGWTIDDLGGDGTTCDLILYYGSSQYDTAQMARLISLIIDECREQGIEYLPPDRLSAMLDAWENR